MLILSRRAGEEIVIPELGITLDVVSVKGKTVRIGIDAPPEIRILRGELTGEYRSKKEADAYSAGVLERGKRNCRRLAAKRAIDAQTPTRKVAV